MAKNDTAYLLWCSTFMGLPGLHRFYLGKPISGLLYLVTFGLFGIGQIVDLFLIPGLVEQKNLKDNILTSAPPDTRLDVTILKICRDKKGATLSDCVIETGATTDEIKKIIHKFCVDDVLIVDNRQGDGAVIYRPI